MAYTGRFAPSPTGPLHAGSLVAALASWLDARAHRGRWVVRIEDVDTPRNAPGAAQVILRQLADCGLVPDEAPLWQSTRDAHYAAALERLVSRGWAFPCGCTRRDLLAAAEARDLQPERHGELVYTGTCRNGLRGKPARAARVLAAPSIDEPDSPLIVDWFDRRLGTQQQDVSREVGDFIVRRADGLWAYQLAVVVDDARQGVTDIVRGEDLADNTARQIHLQALLGFPRPRYLHTPLVLGADGAKLSKQNGARPLDTSQPLEALKAAGSLLEITSDDDTVSGWLARATAQWRERRVEAPARNASPDDPRR